MKQLSIQSITETFSFAVSESLRLHSLSKNGERERYHQETGLHGNLPAQRGEFPHGHYPCSIVAIRRLQEVANSRIENDSDIRGRIVFGSYFSPLKAEIGVRCIRNGEKVTEDLAKEVLKAAKAAALSKLTSATYFFPVFTVDEEGGVDRYSIGNVQFEQTRKFFERTSAEWDESIAGNIAEWTAEAEGRGKKFDGAHIHSSYKQLREHFTKHWWMASVRIESAEDDIAYEKAERVIDQTCTLVRLWVPSWRETFIGPSTHRKNDQHTARFMRSDGGRYNYLMSGGSYGGAVEKEFFSKMRTMPGVPQAEAVVGKISGWEALTTAEERFVSALSWFGEAWKEDRTEAKIVKFAMCLESLLMTGSKEGLTELLSERIALLLGTDYESRRKFFTDAKTVYDARSRAVHGDVLGSDLDFIQASRTVEQLASTAILVFAQLIPALNHASDVKSALVEFFTALKLGGMRAGKEYLGRLLAEQKAPTLS